MVQWLQIGQIRGNVEAFLQDRRGSVFAIMGFGLVMAAGLAALAIDMSYLYGLKGRLQTTADFAVLAAVSQLPDEDAARTMALDYAAKNMPASEHGGVLANADVVTGNWDAGTRTFTPAGDSINAVRVVTRRSQANGNAAGLFFASILGFNQVDVETTAIATSQGGDACIVVLDPTAGSALRIGGAANVTMSCGARVNSTSGIAVRTNGGGCITASSIQVAGDYSGTCFDPPPTAGMTPMADPLAYLNPPSYAPPPAGCDHVFLMDVTTDTTLDPGVYCGGLYIHESPNVILNPGTYVIDGRGLEITGGGVVNGTGVTFYLAPTITGIPSAFTETLNFAGGGQITLSAPTSGEYENILFYQDANAPAHFANVFNGGVTMELNGVLYFPVNHVRFAGNGDPGGATSIVANTVYFTGNANLGSNPLTTTFGPNGMSSGISLVQ